MAGKVKQLTQTEQNRQAFLAIESHWGTVRADFIRSLEPSIKVEIERIYRQEIDAGFVPNTFCSGCYWKACKELINHFNL